MQRLIDRPRQQPYRKGAQRVKICVQRQMQQPCRFYADAKFIDAIFEFPAGKCIAVVPHGIERLRDILAAETGGVQFDPEVVVLHAQIARVVRIAVYRLICLDRKSVV